MAFVEDRWHTAGPDGSRVKTNRHPDNGGGERAKRSAVVLTLDGGEELENSLHRRFGPLRVGRTEWFESAPALEAFISEHAESARAA